jgi:hypothetical protein
MTAMCERSTNVFSTYISADAMKRTVRCIGLHVVYNGYKYLYNKLQSGPMLKWQPTVRIYYCVYFVAETTNNSITDKTDAGRHISQRSSTTFHNLVRAILTQYQQTKISITANAAQSFITTSSAILTQYQQTIRTTIAKIYYYRYHHVPHGSGNSFFDTAVAYSGERALFLGFPFDVGIQYDCLSNLQ